MNFTVYGMLIITIIRVLSKDQVILSKIKVLDFFMSREPIYENERVLPHKMMEYDKIVKPSFK